MTSRRLLLIAAVTSAVAFAASAYAFMRAIDRASDEWT